MISGFQAEIVVWLWAMGVLLHGLSRSYWRPEPDPVRSCGPTLR